MKHIRIYEYYSELPTSFSVADIQNMSETDFLTNLKMLKDKGDEEQFFSLLQIWMNHHKDAKDNPDFVNKFAVELDFDNQEERLEIEDRFFYNKALQLDTHRRGGMKQEIEETKRDIKKYEELLRMAKNKLDRLNVQFG